MLFQELAEEGASPAYSLIENTAFHQDGSGASRPSTAGSREDAGPVAAKEGQSGDLSLQCLLLPAQWFSKGGRRAKPRRSYSVLMSVHYGIAEMTTSEKAEADFHFSSLKRKWHAEEGKYLAHELRRAQDLNVQQEMELESLRQQVAALSRVSSEASLNVSLQEEHLFHLLEHLTHHL